ncbi:MAG TPA: protein kinase, partial [bacterium]|nr:protein kinase [bacterium]
MTHRGGDSERRILQPGSALGEYTITERIGKGFFGRVYAAARTGSDQNHAIKVFRSEVTRRPGFAESLGEAVAPLQALKQTNIAAIHGFDTDRDACWIALDLAPGDGHGARTLQTLSDRFGGILEASTLTGILGGVLGGMAAAHAHGIVHGNLKPGNVL